MVEVEPIYHKVWTLTKQATNQLVSNRRRYERMMDWDVTEEERKTWVINTKQGRIIRALRAAVAPHKPISYPDFQDGAKVIVELCQTCGTNWPCETMENISNVLDGKVKADVHSEFEERAGSRSESA